MIPATEQLAQRPEPTAEHSLVLGATEYSFSESISKRARVTQPNEENI